MPERSTYLDANVAIRTDATGRGFAVRPRQFIASVVEPERLGRALTAAVFDLLADEEGWESIDQAREFAQGLLDNPEGDPVRGTWRRYRYRDGRLDELRVIESLRERGIPVQPNHVYTISSLRLAGDRVVSPNTLTPNTLTPNTLTPNTLTPNTLTPNTLTPNTLTGGWGPGGSCCCPPAAQPRADAVVPTLGAKPAEAPDPADSPPKTSTQVQIHVIDALSFATYNDDADNTHAEPKALVGEYAAPTPPPELPAAYDDNRDAWVDPATGHGDFIKSIVERTSGLTAHLWQAADPVGVIDDAALISALRSVDKASREGDNSRIPHRVLSLSLAGYNETDCSGKPLADQIKAMVEGGWLIVAAAGNNASCRPTFPASLPDVVAVGALGAHAPAWFSNFGAWVDVSAPGVDVLAEYRMYENLPDRLRDLLVRIDHSEEGPDDCDPVTLAAFHTGWATWSGTSFAAPFVAARLAEIIDDPPPGFDATDGVYEGAIRELFENERTAWHPWYGRMIS